MKDKVVVLTGAAGGIGFVLAKRFLDDGAVVVAVDLDSGRLESLAERLNLRSSSHREAEERFHMIAADVGCPDACADLAAQVTARWARTDVLINNAGYFPTCDFREMRYRDWQEVMRVNLDAVFLMSSAFLPLLESQGRGRIINIGSGSVFKGVATQVHYVAAKAGVVGLTRSLARALGPQGITVNVVAPGLTVTPAAVASLGAERLEQRRLERAIPRDQQPEDLTAAVVFLASLGADFVTGQTLLVDGGGFMH